MSDEERAQYEERILKETWRKAKAEADKAEFELKVIKVMSAAELSKLGIEI